MGKIDIFGDGHYVFEEDKLPSEIVKSCGCVYKLHKTTVGIGYILENPCSEHRNELSFDALKCIKLKLLENIFRSLISKTDYIYLKAQDLGVDVSIIYPNKIKWRKDLRTWYENKEKIINQLTTKEELQTIRFDDYPPIPEEA